MKSLFLALCLLSVNAAAADDVWREIPSDNPFETIYIVKTEASQAAEYVSTEKLFPAWTKLAENNETIKAVLAEAYAQNECGPDGNYLDPEMKDMFCGFISEMATENTVLWAFGRGGWAEAGAGYRSFLTFTGAGTGRFTQVILDLDSSVDVGAEGPMNEEDGTVEFRVVVKFERVRLYNLDGNVSRTIELK